MAHLPQCWTTPHPHLPLSRTSEVVVGHRPIRSLASRGPGPSATPPEQAAAQKLKESLAMKGKPVTWTAG